MQQPFFRPPPEGKRLTPEIFFLNETITKLLEYFAVKFAGFHIGFNQLEGIQRAFGSAVRPFFIG
jgi:hypothetical protein